MAKFSEILSLEKSSWHWTTNLFGIFSKIPHRNLTPSIYCWNFLLHLTRILNMNALESSTVNNHKHFPIIHSSISDNPFWTLLKLLLFGTWNYILQESKMPHRLNLEWTLINFLSGVPSKQLRKYYPLEPHQNLFHNSYYNRYFYIFAAV